MPRPKGMHDTMFAKLKRRIEARLLDRYLQERRALRKAMPRTALSPDHTARGRLLPDRLALLDHLPKGGTVAEIGVAKGDFSAEILARCAPDRLHLIDAWHTGRYAPAKAAVLARFAPAIAAGQVVVNPGLSLDVLSGFPDAAFDWVYIDTDHSYRLTAAELTLCARLVKPGGRICGHDFTTGNIVAPVVYGVVQAVNEFCMAKGWEYEFLTLESDCFFSFCIRAMADRDRDSGKDRPPVAAS